MIFEMGRRRDGGPIQKNPQSPQPRLCPNGASGSACRSVKVGQHYYLTLLYLKMRAFGALSGF